MRDIRIGMSIGMIVSMVFVEYQRYKMSQFFDQQDKKNEEQVREIFHRYKMK